MNINSLEQVISENDIIMIDTSSLMNTKELSKMINKWDMLLRINRKKIYVTKPVWAELNKHLQSRNIEKQNKACEVIDIICMNRSIFYIDDSALMEDEIKGAFADPRLLSELTVNKTVGKQLFITNDKHLLKDALNLNNLESCEGYEIVACSIDRDGDLYVPNVDISEPVKVMEESILAEKHVRHENEKEHPSYAGIWGFIGGVSATVLVSKYGKSILKLVNKVA